MATTIGGITPSWNPKKRLVWSSRGSQKEVPAEQYNEYLASGWKASAPATVQKPSSVSDKTSLDLGDGDNLPITVIPKRSLISDVKPEPLSPDITVPELTGLGQRFGVDGIAEIPAFRTDLDATQQKNIETLIKTKPQSQWSDKDWSDFSWATETTREAPAITGNAVIDAYNKRPDVQSVITKAFPGQDPFKQGTAANRWLNDWWNRTGATEMAEQIPLEEDIAVITGDDLVDYYNTRPDVVAAASAEFPGQDPLQQGTEANEWLKNWWSTTGQAEMADEAAKGTFTPTVPVETTAPEGGTLVDYYGTRTDVQTEVEKLFPGQDPYKAGTEANTWLNDWFERTGRAEMADETAKGTYTPTAETTDADTIIPDGTPEQKSAFQSIIDKIKEMVGIKKEAFDTAAEELDLEGKSDKITEIETTIQDRKEFYSGEKTRIANRLASGHVIDAEQSKLEGQRITEMTNLEIRQSIAQGNWDRAHQLAKDTAQDAYDAAELEIKALEIQGVLDENEKDDLMEMLKFHRDLALDGFVAITEEEAATLPVENYITFPDGSIYALPVDFGEEAEADPNIGKTVKIGEDVFMWNTNTGAYDIKVGAGGDVSTEDASMIAALQDKNIVIDSIIADDQVKNITGTGVTATVGFTSHAILGTTQDVILKVQQVLSKETMDTLIALKARGGTLGALSDQERIMLQNAATSIGGAAVLNKQGKVIGYNMSKEAFIKEMGVIKMITDRAISALSDFSNVEGDTNSALIALVGKEDGEKGGQCGRFVNSITGLGVGDSYASKMAKMDKSITTPEPGMVFTMPYKDTGHVGIILSIKDGIATVKDSNYKLDEKILTHAIPISKMTGFANYNRLA